MSFNLNMKRSVLWCVCLALAACASFQSNRPAENDRVKIEYAGFITAADQDNQQAQLIWYFNFSAKPSLKKLESVMVEEVLPDKSFLVLVQDNAPVLKDGLWAGRTAGVPANRTSTPWLYAKNASTSTFRFTIKPEGEPPFILYQPVSFPDSVKEVS
ncbi:MAG: hypothetical protein LBI87_09120 [Candidatus Accumulibacter sp.]|jgi:hypothetical protein|nr:hypothetical protein [Accumulibacter sp.]